MDHQQSTISVLPTDILLLILSTLNVQGLASLSQTCRWMHELVSEFGWTAYARLHPRPSHSISNSRNIWTPREQVRYDYLTDRSWSKTDFVARPLSRTWGGKQSPNLAISNSRLIVAAGSTLFSYAFCGTPNNNPSITLEATLLLNEQHVRGRNITSITFLEDGGLDQTLLVAYQEQLVEVIHLVPVVQNGKHTLTFRRKHQPAFPRDDYIESFSASGQYLLSLSSNGTARLLSQAVRGSSSAASSSSTIELGERSWRCHLSADASTPFAAFGTSGKTPLTIYSVLPDRLSPTPHTILHAQKTTPTSTDSLPSLAVYGIARAPLASPMGSSPQILVSGWFDGQVRIYDLRSSNSVINGDSSSGPTFLKPVMSINDRWLQEPIYAVACGGGSAAHIAAGTARHSVVSFWDVRSPKTGWSVHAPGNDRSPVFSVILESSRFFGATESRPFVYDFGPNPTLETYPPLAAPAPPPTRGGDREGLKYKPGLVTYRVVKYHHASSGLPSEH
ncbi:hypothetical protein FA15DRAFT_635363 [Coprinopsis marcescibilis]|uniref:F-box domain-containing protein n=1 Tax=Coprinopsis marcescibilis TaxID=230819 RepID=A0A5C3L3Y5_COPMA|nr:hypothetical protein FA15DRAFT_635363 [Coprinopsis marcescibilis]